MLSSTRGNLPVSEVREHIGMSGLLGQRAVVVGAGVGGLSMAGASANCFEQVEILERDRLTASIGSRSGTLQDRHPHAVLAGGFRALDEIFPGFAGDLAGAGAVSVRVAQDIQFRAAGWRPRAETRFRNLAALRIQAADRVCAARSGRNDQEYIVAAAVPGNRDCAGGDP